MKNKKRIQVIIPDRLKHPMGGMGVGLSHTIEGLQKDFDFDIIGFPEEGHPKNYYEVFNPLQSILHGSVTTLYGQIAYLERSIACSKPDIIHAYDWSTYLAGVYAARHFNVPLVVTMQLSVNLLGELGIFYVNNPQAHDGIAIHRSICEMEIYGLRQATKIIQISNAYRERFKVLPELDSKTVVIPHGINLSEWKASKKVRLPGKNSMKVVYIARFFLFEKEL